MQAAVLPDGEAGVGDVEAFDGAGGRDDVAVPDTGLARADVLFGNDVARDAGQALFDCGDLGSRGDRGELTVPEAIGRASCRERV